MRTTIRLSLIEARRAKGWSQQQLADLLGTTQHSISRWEQGHTHPAPFFLVKLCRLYGKDPFELDLAPAPWPEKLKA